MDKKEELFQTLVKKVEEANEKPRMRGYIALVTADKLFRGDYNDIVKGMQVYSYLFYKIAAEEGYPEGMYNLGMCYRWGEGGVYADPEVALQYFREAAEKGHEKAKGILQHYDSEHGKYMLLMSAMSGVEGYGSKWYNTKEGVDTYYEKANAGDTEAQYELARQLANPERYGPFKFNIQEAIKWYTEAGNNGVVDAMFNLANIYMYGSGEQKIDKEKAKEWYQKCADAGDEEAAMVLKHKF